MSKNVGDKARNKYLVVVGKDEQGNAVGFVLVNYVVNQHLSECRHKLHYLLKASMYDFLENQDRYVDCSDFKTISKKRFAELFSTDKRKGNINETDFVEIKKFICTYENISKKTLKRFGLLEEF